MDLEESLKSFRLRGSADPLREDVLRRARRARFERRLWRWTWVAAAAVVVVAFPINGSVGRPEPAVSREQRSVPGPLREGELRERARIALVLPITPRTLPENHP